MAASVIKKGTYIHKRGQSFTSLHLITAGQVIAAYPGGSYILKKGDVIGISELCSEIHLLDYIAAENTTVVVYPLSHENALSDLLKSYPDVSRFFMLSAFRQIHILMQQSLVSEMKCSSIYQALSDDLDYCAMLHNRYRLGPVTEIISEDDPVAYLSDESADFWLSSYYLELYHIYAGKDYKPYLEKTAVSVGSLKKCSLDYRKTYFSLEEQHQYRLQTLQYFINENHTDLFEQLYKILNKIGSGSPDAPGVIQRMDDIIALYRDMTSDSNTIIEERIIRYQSVKEMMQDRQTVLEQKLAENSLPEELRGSMDTILNYASISDEFVSGIRANIRKFKQLPDINASDDVTYALRKKLAADFLTLYETTFMISLEDTSPLPMAVKMFLLFGYIDEEMAGTEYSIMLYKLAHNLQSHVEVGIYTLYDWLLAIYRGEKEPCRNEFDQDYTDVIHKKKISGQFIDLELNEMLNDPLSKVVYELQNMFPSVNKMTFGRITTYFPFFTRDNVLRNPEDSLVTVEKISHALDVIRSVDYSAFYRESLDYDHMDTMGKELIHLEFLPDIILMPNVGIHGVMWQEIEGKKRNSHSRMMFSIFHMEDVTTTLIHLTGEFRWEMCKRIQGARWNDITENSLTSEYFDYIQFYRKNHELSAEAKDKVRIALKRAKNSFKEMFIRDYILWILFEASGSPRLNKVARRIFFTHCPFPADIDENLSGNPLYTELVNRKQIKKAARLQHLRNLAKKLAAGKGVPDSLQSELFFVEFGKKS
ncbi:MAG: hypothetical protein IKL04_03110 [Lachnospiraceae bacterium]|nr:hypothetical protein [Lachnospiraceae bacterium]